LIIRELELTNIRTHGHTLIRFPAGKTLLEGDIGSGKSSVLMAIEFALFGLGSESGGSVLKLGQERGEVRMVFDIDGTEYEVIRRLQRKAGRVQQSDGFLKSPVETVNLSPSELKEKVLDVLEFNEAPDPKAQSWIYRYAVYTPQEEMKNILTLAPEQRLQILRRAFRVEDYKTAANNAEEAARQLRVDTSRLDGISEGVDELRKEMEHLRQEEGRLKAELTELERKTAGAEEEVGRLRREKEDIQRRELSLRETRAEKEYYERMGREASRDAADVAREIRELRGRLKQIDEITRREPSMPASHIVPLSELKRRERASDGKVKKLTALKAAVESKLSDYQSIMKNGVCPVCDRPARAHDFEDRLARKDAERRHASEELEIAEAELADLRERIERTSEFVERRKELALNRSERSNLKKEVERKESSLARYEKRSRFASSTLVQLGRSLDDLEGVVERGKATTGKIVEAEGALRRARDDMVKGKERLESVQKQQTKIAIEIVSKEDASNRSRRLKGREVWLTDYFLPTVRVVEKSVLATINQEFDLMFKRWFGMLVVDQGVEVSVDEDFTPVVSQGGYEQDVRYLSGGERTSVALAYRLALNVLVQRVSAGMRSNLLILDEPTDGFSQEQLGNVREVLDEVGSPQIIIVSHDKELESFADQIYRVEKTGSESTVRTPLG
jgi:exonuclease SbcC